MASVAIDGPAGAGKSTIAKQVAKKLGAIYVDTGAMYRAIALYLLKHNIDIADKKSISACCKQIEVTIQYKNGEQQVLLNGENVTSYLRTEAVSKMASVSSSNSDVRETLLELQRSLAKTKNVVMDGRDIGTNVLPNAEVKIYLTASPSVRAKRRYDELVAKGEMCQVEQIQADIIERDQRDMNREIAPLKQADDAYFLDSSNMSIDEVVDSIWNECMKKVPEWK